MKTELFNISLNFDQILDLVRQLLKSQKAKLLKELEKESIDIKLNKLLYVFRTDELSLNTIDQELEMVRQELHEIKQSKSRFSRRMIK